MIETGFSDLNRINTRWRSNHDGVRYLDLMARMLLYNSWKMNKTWVNLKTIKANTSRSLTLSQNQDYLIRGFYQLSKNHRG